MVLVVPAIWLLVRAETAPGARASIAVALGPVLVAIGFAFGELAWWNGADGVLLVLLAAAAAAVSGPAGHPRGRWTLAALAALAMLPGAYQVFHRAGTGAGNELNEAEQVGRIERDLARWLAACAGGREVVVLAPYDETVTLYY